MEILITNRDGTPIYEQIVKQIKDKILEGSLQSGEALPSIRELAKELRISVITTKRAYEELQKDGFIETVPGKGSFVHSQNSLLLEETKRRFVEDKLSEAFHLAKLGGLKRFEIDEIIKVLLEDYG